MGGYPLPGDTRPFRVMTRAQTDDRAEAKEWAATYVCHLCGARAKVGYKFVTVTHSRACPNYRYRSGVRPRT